MTEAPENEERHAALWEAVRALYDHGPLTTAEVFVRCDSWPKHRRATRRAYLLSVLHEAKDLKLATSRLAVPRSRNGRCACLVWAITDYGVEALFGELGIDKVHIP